MAKTCCGTTSVLILRCPCLFCGSSKMALAPGSAFLKSSTIDHRDWHWMLLHSSSLSQTTVAPKWLHYLLAGWVSSPLSYLLLFSPARSLNALTSSPITAPLISLPPDTHFAGQLKMAPGAVLLFRYAGSVSALVTPLTLAPMQLAPTAWQRSPCNGKTHYFIDIAVFAKVLEKRLLLLAQWPGAYKTMAKAIT